MGAGSFNRKVTSRSHLLLTIFTIIGCPIITYTLLSQPDLDKRLLFITALFYLTALISTITLIRNWKSYFVSRRRRRIVGPADGPSLKEPPRHRYKNQP